MRRAHGVRSPATLETYALLAQLYTSTGLTYQAQAAKGEKTGALALEYFRKAVGVHEDVLRVLVAGGGSGQGDVGVDGEEDDEVDTAAELLAREGVSVPSHAQSHSHSHSSSPSPQTLSNAPALALTHLHLLKHALQRLGTYPKSYAHYEALNAALFRAFGGEKSWTGAQGTEKWDIKSYGSGKAEGKEGAFEGVADWGFGEEKVLKGEA